AKGNTCDYTVLTSVRPSEHITIPLTNPEGLLRINAATRTSECSDGLSNTLLVIEDAARPERWASGALVPGRYSGGVWSDADGVSSLRGYSRDGLTQDGSCPVNCSNNGEIYSFHRTGAHILLADGSVRSEEHTSE